jgi:sugar/nucleoside kinase (ribokinase family)
MPPTYDVLSFGTIGLDYILRVPDWPTPERGVHAPGEEEHLGGNALNVAVLLGGWGLRVAISGHAIGDDRRGARLVEWLDAHPNVSREYLRQVEGLHTMYCRILVNPEGERAIIGVTADENPSTTPTPSMIRDAGLLTLDLYGGVERVGAARLAAEAGRPVVVGDVRRAENPVLAYTTVAIASAAEVRAGYPNQPIARFIEMVQAEGVRGVIVTDGPRDVLVFEAGRPPVAVRQLQIEVVDTIGAGDAFRAGVVYGLKNGWPLVEAAAFGAASGSINVQHSGGAGYIPDVSTVSALAARLVRRSV